MGPGDEWPLWNVKEGFRSRIERTRCLIDVLGLFIVLANYPELLGLKQCKFIISR